MTGSPGEGRGAGSGSRSAEKPNENLKQMEQIEYLLHQSTQGVHFVFDNSEIARVMGGEIENANLSSEHLEKVQKLISGFLDRPSIGEKRSYLEHLSQSDYEILLKAYFQLVDKAILANSNLRH